MRRQEKYDKEKMALVVGKYKNEFVDEFKDACKHLEITQSSVIRNAMIETIEKSKEKK